MGVKIRRVKFLNDDLFDNLEFDFTNPNTGEIFNNIIFVGSNGAGKTTLLNSISGIINSPTRSYNYDYCEYELNGNLIRFNRLADDNYNKFEVIDLDANKKYPIDSMDDDYPIEYRVSYNDIIISSSNHDYGQTKMESFESIIARLVELQNEECINYAYYNIKHDTTPKRWSVFFQTTKTKIFADAFNQFFDNMKYFGIGFNNNKKIVIGFTKFGKEINTNVLSSGEKQIIERTVPILEKMTDKKDNILFLDEPEMSLHPQWQSKLLPYFKKLFSNSDGVQQNQIVVASHSSLLLKEALKDDKTLIVRLQSQEGTIVAERMSCPTFLTDITFAEVNYLVFDIASPEYHNQLYCQIQKKFNKNKVLSCDNFILQHAHYDASKHSRISGYGNVVYHTICSYIRNSIDHYDNGNRFTEEELRISIRLMQDILT